MDDLLGRIEARLDARVPRRIEEPEAREAAVALILVPTDASGVELLLIRRAERAGDPWSGQMALPGGRWETGDDGLVDTATRETREETGIVLSPSALLGELDDFFPNTPVLPKVVVRPFVFGVGERPAVSGSPEVASSLWVSLDTLRASRQRVEVVVRDGPLLVDAFVLGEDVVWGITHRILQPLVDLDV